MRTSSLLLAAFFVSALAGCSDPVDPVPHVEDPHKIVVDGVAMTQLEFLERFCEDDALKEAHPSCVKVLRALQKDSIRTPGGARRF